MAHNPFSLRPPLYGFQNFEAVFTPRQLRAMTTFSSLVLEARDQVTKDACTAEAAQYADAIATYLACAVSRAADYWSTGATWEPTGGFVGHTFTRQALPMVWDFCEANPFSRASGDWDGAIDWVARVIVASPTGDSACVVQRDARDPFQHPRPVCVSTDPPYYNNVDYADLSDYFYVWLRKSIASIYPALFTTVATPKEGELVSSPYRFNGKATEAKSFFEEGLSAVFRNIHAVQHEEVPFTVFYAFKQAEADGGEREEDDGGVADLASTGWETMLEGLVAAQFVVDATWPMRTERGARSMSINMNALASSVVLACRPGHSMHR